MYISIICLNNGFFLSQSFTVAAFKCIEVHGLCMSAGIEGVTQVSNSSHGFICCVSCSSSAVLHSVIMYKHMRWGSAELTVGVTIVLCGAGSPWHNLGPQEMRIRKGGALTGSGESWNGSYGISCGDSCLALSLPFTHKGFS